MSLAHVARQERFAPHIIKLWVAFNTSCSAPLAEFAHSAKLTCLRSVPLVKGLLEESAPVSRYRAMKKNNSKARTQKADCSRWTCMLMDVVEGQ